ncbi:hypothetical protein ACO0LB_19395 [Undibacterium sp. SXout7W]|uniref:hypothetical protein n=1 Tax=Undibacterium sp. SXout7W TaxID=3413049 RepID=UPI003BF23246
MFRAFIAALLLILTPAAHAAPKIEFWIMSLKPKFISYFQQWVARGGLLEPHDVSGSTRMIVAGTVLTVAPILAAFLFTQCFFMHGMDGAVK